MKGVEVGQSQIEGIIEVRHEGVPRVGLSATFDNESFITVSVRPEGETPIVQVVSWDEFFDVMSNLAVIAAERAGIDGPDEYLVGVREWEPA